MKLAWLPLGLATGALSTMVLPADSVCSWMPRHPKFDCSSSITCEPGWQSETGDYGENSAQTASAASSGEPLQFPDSFTNATMSQPGLSDPLIAQLKSDISTTATSKTCCRPTVDCWVLLTMISSSTGLVTEKFGKTTMTYIEDLETWKKAACCFVDYWLSCDCPETEIKKLK
ncbi:hypothetical protein H2200_004917 [Cladophialophora chaetospira]|uniref:Uncharacterized protein n=1 Tax=Cladophialophora chaetospira TaxID=386627 RepID=A0AA39CKL6_9EURO|nr:hypothetical protein H2200_004917 [Cladophialophora chaetospira]